MWNIEADLELLRKHKLYAGLSRCDFYDDRIHYLGCIISDKGVYVNPEKTEAMMSWPAPRKLTDVISFVGLARYCRKFNKEYFVGKSGAYVGNGPCVYGHTYEDFMKT